MQVFRGIPERAEHGCVLTIGNFDGVHRGHQALLTKLTDKARVTGLPSAVLTFEPHPREFFAHDNRPRRLTSLREKIQLLAAHGVDRLYIARFNTRFAGLTAEQFIEDVLIHGLGVRHLLIGDDFCFGKARKGDFAMLQAAGQQTGFTVESRMPLFRMVFEHELRPEGAATRVVHRVAFSGLLAALLGRMLVKRLNQGLPVTLAKLKRRAEGGA